MPRSSSISAAAIKEAIEPGVFYRSELPGMKAPQGRARQVNGGLCPFHADTRPNSFFLNLMTGAYICFSCGVKGSDVIAFLMARDGCSFPEALRYLRENYT